MRPWRLRFGARVMFAAVSALCVLLAIVANRIRQTAPTRSAVAFIEQHRGLAWCDAQVTNPARGIEYAWPSWWDSYLGDCRVVAVQFDGQVDLTDADLERLRPLVNLRRLSLSGTRVTDAGLARIAHLNELRELFLDGTDIGDDGLAYLAGMQRLCCLYIRPIGLDDGRIHTPKVTDAGVARLKQSLPDVEVYR